MKIPHTCTSWSKCVTCISLRSSFWLSKICDESMPHFHTYPKLHSKAISGRIWKRRKIFKCLWWGFIHIERSRESFEELTCYFTKHIKPPDRWLIKERMIGNSVTTVLSCNSLRTWKSYTPHRDQGKGWIKIPTYLNCETILCYRHAT